MANSWLIHVMIYRFKDHLYTNEILFCIEEIKSHVGINIQFIKIFVILKWYQLGKMFKEVKEITVAHFHKRNYFNVIV